MIGGVKLTHDAAVAAIADGVLVGCIEAEKLDNRSRHARLADLDEARALIQQQFGAPEQFVVDGWRPSLMLDVAPYVASGDPMAAIEGDGYRSYAHATNHVFAAYCTSPFAEAREPADVLVWDGGMPARIYRFDPRTRVLSDRGVVLDITGAVYPIFAVKLASFGAVRDVPPGDEHALAQATLPVSGKAMALAGCGVPNEEVIDVLARVTRSLPPTDAEHAFRWSEVVLRRVERLGCSDPVLLASMQEFLGRELERALARVDRLCLSGGCALNIAWNARLRHAHPDLWVPPFPNDSGSAIGAACTEMVASTGNVALDWNVFSGPPLRRSTTTKGRTATIEDVARLLHDTGEPVVILDGRAELGPRALGHRSIVAPATARAMHGTLNAIKERESYRPVAPMCLEGEAPKIFDPGTRDPFMLFDHAVRPAWRERIPAVVHADGTARLQTVGPDNELMYRLLSEYHALSGIPVLCNTSANGKGCGFFPDVASALEWGRVANVWSDGTLYSPTPGQRLAPNR